MSIFSSLNSPVVVFGAHAWGGPALQRRLYLTNYLTAKVVYPTAFLFLFLPDQQQGWDTIPSLKLHRVHGA